MKLSQTDEYIIKRIEEDIDFFVDNSISIIIKNYNVSESTFLRLVKKLNYNSIMDMKVDFIKKYSLNNLLELNYGDHVEEEDLINNTAALSLYSIINTKKNLSIENLNQVVDILLSGSRISVFGIGNSYMAAEYFSKQLNRIGILNSLGNSFHHVAVKINFIEVNEVFIIFSCSGQTLECVKIAQLAKEHNIQVILITGDKSQNNKVLEYADHCILYSNHKDELNPFPSTSSYMGQIFVSTLIFNLVLDKIPNSKEKLLKAKSHTNYWNGE